MAAWRKYWDSEAGQYYYQSDDGRTQYGQPADYAGNPWQGDRTGWIGGNADAIFSTYARSEFGNVGAQTLAGLRSAGVSDDAAVAALWKAATESANPEWSGGSPTGIERGIYQAAGVLNQLDSAAKRAAQASEDSQTAVKQAAANRDPLGAIVKGAILAMAGAGLESAFGAAAATTAVTGPTYLEEEAIALAEASGSTFSPAVPYPAGNLFDAGNLRTAKEVASIASTAISAARVLSGAGSPIATTARSSAPNPQFFFLRHKGA